jgi:hypothetical protein
MADVVFQGFYNEVPAPGDTPDLRAILVMGSSTILSEPAAETVGDFTLLDEFDGIGYARYDCAGVTVTYQTGTTPDQVEINFTDGDDVFGDPVAAGGDDIMAMLVVRNVDGGNGDIPWVAVDVSDVQANSGKLGLTLPATGVLVGKQA